MLIAYNAEGKEVEPGTIVLDFRGDAFVLASCDRAAEPGRSGKVTATDTQGHRRYFNDNVFNLTVKDV